MRLWRTSAHENGLPLPYFQGRFKSRIKRGDVCDADESVGRRSLSPIAQPDTE